MPGIKRPLTKLQRMDPHGSPRCNTTWYLRRKVLPALFGANMMRKILSRVLVVWTTTVLVFASGFQSPDYARRLGKHPTLRNTPSLFLPTKTFHRSGGTGPPSPPPRPPVLRSRAFDFDEGDARNLGLLIALGLIAAAILNTIVVVPSSNVGVMTTFGTVAERILSEGLHFKSPFQRIHLFSVKTQLLDPKFQSVPTREGLTVQLDTAILYHINAEGARDIFRKLGPQFERLVVGPALFSAVRGLTSEYEAKALYTTGRNEIQRKLTEELAKTLGARGIQVEEVLLKEVKLPRELSVAIETKMRREQESEQMEFVLLKERQESERKRIEAQGIQDFQNIVSKGITPGLLKWKGIEATEKLAKSPNSKVVVVGTGSNSLPVILNDDRKNQ